MSGLSSGLWAGLDIGGSKVHAVALDGHGRVVADHRARTLGGGSGVLASAREALRAAATGAGTGVRGFDGVGVGVPGLVDSSRGGVSHAVNLGLDGDALALSAFLGELTGAPVSVENDVNAAALGAARLLAADGPAGADGGIDGIDGIDGTGGTGGTGGADLAYLSIGTGLAAGLVLGGRLRRGFRGAAGEIGHIPLDAAGPACPCGQRGCLEVLASGAAIARAWPSPPGVPAAEALWDAADAGDPAARRVRADVVAHLAVAVRLLALTVDVERVVLGGGVAELGERLAERVRDRLHQVHDASPFLRALDLPGRVTVVPPGRSVAAVGAALVGRQAALARATGAPAARVLAPVALDGARASGGEPSWRS